MIEKEYITCSAIWYSELPTLTFLPKNIEHGSVVAGHRHHNIINVVYLLHGKRTVHFGENSCGKDIFGFLTSKNRFVDRKEAVEIAYNAGQIKELKRELFSEDIY